MGSDVFSVPSLRTCLAQTEVVAVYTQPDRRTGRGRTRLTASPVKELAVEAGRQVEQPERFDNEATERLRSFEPDLTVVAAYGHLLGRRVREAARLDTINVHASLLPRHRGAAPVAAAIRAGDPVTGVTVMKVRRRLDAGEILCVGDPPRPAARATKIGERETTGELTERLADMGGEVLADVLRAFSAGSVTTRLQDDTAATHAPRLRKADGRIDWSLPAAVIDRHVRAMHPWPGAFSELHVPGHEPHRVIVLEARPVEGDGRPGELMIEGDRALVGTGEGRIELLRVKPAGRGERTGAEFAHGVPAARDETDGGCAFAGA
jgi:methionyl-tRNA formyltransferase